VIQRYFHIKGFLWCLGQNRKLSLLGFSVNEVGVFKDVTKLLSLEIMVALLKQPFIWYFICMMTLDLSTLRADLQQILTTIPTGASVLDLGCGDGALLQALITQKSCKALGVELDEANVQTCMGKGLPVFHGTLEEALADYPPQHFDFVVLNQTLQRTKLPVPVVHGMLRVGKRAIVGFPNFGHWQIRLALLARGKNAKFACIALPMVRYASHPPVSHCGFSSLVPARRLGN
jgi:methionine biosynthesis protein MetW